MQENSLKRAIDTDLSGLRTSERERAIIFQNALEGKKVKKKISVALVFALVVVLIAGIALAVISLRDTARQIVETEQTDGRYVDWPIEKKSALVSALVDLGYTEETTKVKQLLANTLLVDEAHQVADDVLVAFTGREVSEVSFMIIMETAWGPFDQWTKEEQAWYSKLMVDVGIQKDDHTLYLEPEGSIDEAQAISIARREIAKGYGIAESELDKYSVITTFQVPEFAEPGDDQPYWCVEYMAPEDMSEDVRLFIQFSIFIHPETGIPLESVQSILARNTLPEQFSHPLYDALKTLSDQADSAPLWDRTLEQKTEYSEMINPMVREILNSGDLSTITFDGQTDNSLIAASTYTYGLPGESDISQEQAFKLAVNAVQETYGLDEDTIGLYKLVSVYFDVTNPEKPLWKYLFRPETWRDFEGGLDSPQYGLRYRVELDARTGDIISAEEFEFKAKDGTDLEYELKWH